MQPSPVAHRTQAKALARNALGLGLRLPHYAYIREHRPQVDYFEIISENFMSGAFFAEKNLEEIHRHYPIVLHGVGLNLLGHEELDATYLDRLCLLADQVDAPFVSDHLCWTASHGAKHHDLLPTPYRHDLVAYAAERAAHVQTRLGRPFALENLSSYATFAESDMSEWDFYAAVVKTAGCWLLLDINNIYVSSQNHGFDPVEYLESIDFSRVLQVHLAGHELNPHGPIVDTHDRPVAAEVWELYRQAWLLGGPFPTLIEWDDKIPSMPEVLAELERAKRVQNQ